MFDCLGNCQLLKNDSVPSSYMFALSAAQSNIARHGPCILSVTVRYNRQRHDARTQQLACGEAFSDFLLYYKKMASNIYSSLTKVSHDSRSGSGEQCGWDIKLLQTEGNQEVCGSRRYYRCAVGLSAAEPYSSAVGAINTTCFNT